MASVDNGPFLADARAEGPDAYRALQHETSGQQIPILELQGVPLMTLAVAALALLVVCAVATAVLRAATTPSGRMWRFAVIVLASLFITGQLISFLGLRSGVAAVAWIVALLLWGAYQILQLNRKPRAIH